MWLLLLYLSCFGSINNLIVNGDTPEARDVEGPADDDHDDVEVLRRVKRGGKHYCQSPSTNPCQNGNCITNDGGYAHYQCNCHVGWTGTNCDLIDCTSQIHCNNHGDCQPINGGHDKICNCFYGWQGQTCTDEDVCTPYKKADIAFVIDISLSEGNGTFHEQKQFVKNFMSKYKVGPPNNRYQFSLVTYSYQATVHFYFNDHSNDADLQNAVDNVKVDCSGPSFTGTALKKVRQHVFSSTHGARNETGVERYVIVLTDGLSSDPNVVITEANELKQHGVKIYAVGTGSSIRHEELLKIASFNHFVFPMATEDCLQSLLKHTMFGCDSCSQNFSDVAILMDVSSNTTIKDFNTLVEAVTYLLKSSHVGPNATQFSFSTFTSDTYSIFNFTTYANRVNLIADVNKKTRQESSTNANTSRALNKFNENGFSSLRGSRSDARKILVLITSGNVDDIEEVKMEAKRLKDSGKFVVSIGAGLDADLMNLLEISSDPALTFVLGEDIHINVNVLDALRTTLAYDYCQHV